MTTRQAYLSKEARERLPHYQYHGSDLSLLYKYALSPFANFCVERFIPRTMAPNTITLFGLAWMVLSYAFYWYYVPSLTINKDGQAGTSEEDSYPPRWIFLFNAIAMFVYQNLDNMDGKQARRTQSSSPLGLLFDHGCDAINSTFGSANWIIGMALVPAENLLQVFGLIFGPYALFYISTWEHYVTGELNMPIFNGPNEGLLGGILLSLTTWWYGPQFWQGDDWQTSIENITSSELPLSMRNCDFVITFAMIATLNELVTKSIFVIRRHPGAAASLLPFVVLTACYVIVALVDPLVWLTSPRMSLHLTMVLFVEMSTELMLVHVTEQPFRPFARWHLLPLIGLTIPVVVVSGFATEYSDLLQSCLRSYLWSMSFYLCSKTYHVIQEMCDSLGIWCFDIVTPHPNAGNPNSMQQIRAKSKKM